MKASLSKKPSMARNATSPSTQVQPVADIVDEFILGLDIMKQFNFISVDFEKRLLKVGNVEIIFSTSTEKNNRIRLIMDEDVRIPGNTEAIVTAHLEGKPDGVDIFLVEPDASRYEDALVAKCLVDGRRTVPVRVANLNVNRVTLKKGEAIGISRLEERLKTVHEFARNRLLMTSDRMKMRLDVKPGQNVFKEGDAVWLYQPGRKKGLSPKLQRPWEGTYLIVKTINDLVYRIQMSPKAKPKVVHVERLSLYRDKDPPTWRLQEAVRGEQSEGGGQCYKSILVRCCHIYVSP
ncbi:hypothetical protein NQ315_002595 [Exocentrus adspersus]|uniref:Integrase p58-like C-terminal domain-containing protein n=1 Tax=Exocentrus adspersus TaxID=1586481 RepID=A0AAV8VUD6_9CUCU|nr:hypothetical protein NQ315_002595 [Exocentrus adspersus]